MIVDHDAGGAVHDQQDLHLANAVGLGDLVPVEHLQHNRLLRHIGQRHLWVQFSHPFQAARLTLNWKDSLNVGLRFFLITLVFNS